MRTFILGGKVAYGSGDNVNDISAGAIAFTYNKDGAFTVDTDGTGITKEGNIVLGRTIENGGPIVIPFYKNRVFYSKMVYQEATKYKAIVTIPDIDSIGDYTLVIAKKGVKFNERNKWTSMYHNTKLSTTSATVAKYITDSINSNNAGVTATVSESVITITANNNNEDFVVMGADELFGISVTETAPTFSHADANYVRDLADKAAANSGFEYTYRDDVNYLYPNYPSNPLASNDADDVGFTIFTLKFAEPREVKTRDEVVNQIVQIAIPTGAAAIDTIETILKKYSGIE